MDATTLLLLITSFLNGYLVLSLSIYPTDHVTRKSGFKLFSVNEGKDGWDEIIKQPSVEILIPQYFPHNESILHKKSYPSSLHSIYVHRVLNEAQANHTLFLAKEYARISQCWSKKNSERHASYATVDFPIEDCSDLEEYLDTIGFRKGMIELLSLKYGVPSDALSFQDLFCVHYQANENASSEFTTMDRLAPHRDGTILSFTVVLSDKNEYDGGGTIFESLRDVDPSEHPEYKENLKRDGVIRVRNPGDSVLHSGKILHGGHSVSWGKRTVLVGFVDVEDCYVRKGVLAEACKSFGRMDNAEKRLQRQLEKIRQQPDFNQVARGRWNHSPHFPVGRDGKFDSRMRFIPAFTSVHHRGRLEYQRRIRMEAEDVLLREILHLKDERLREVNQEFDGHDEITILS